MAISDVYTISSIAVAGTAIVVSFVSGYYSRRIAAGQLKALKEQNETDRKEALARVDEDRSGALAKVERDKAQALKDLDTRMDREAEVARIEREDMRTRITVLETMARINKVTMERNLPRLLKKETTPRKDELIQAYLDRSISEEGVDELEAILDGEIQAEKHEPREGFIVVEFIAMLEVRKAELTGLIPVQP